MKLTSAQMKFVKVALQDPVWDPNWQLSHEDGTYYREDRLLKIRIVWHASDDSFTIETW